MHVFKVIALGTKNDCTIQLVCIRKHDFFGTQLSCERYDPAKHDNSGHYLGKTFQAKHFPAKLTDTGIGYEDEHVRFKFLGDKCTAERCD